MWRLSALGLQNTVKCHSSLVAFRGLWCSAWEARPCTSAEQFRHLRDRDGCLASCCTWRRVVCLIPLTVTHVSRFPESMENQPWHNLDIRLFMPIISTSLTRHVLKKLVPLKVATVSVSRLMKFKTTRNRTCIRENELQHDEGFWLKVPHNFESSLSFWVMALSLGEGSMVHSPPSLFFLLFF